jgi:hypothetical protein
MAIALSGRASLKLMPTPSRGHGTQRVKTALTLAGSVQLIHHEKAASQGR